MSVSTFLKFILFLVRNFGKKKAVGFDMSGSMITFKKEKRTLLKVMRLLTPRMDVISQTNRYSYTDHSDILKQAKERKIEALLYFTDGYDVPKVEKNVTFLIPKKLRSGVIVSYKKLMLKRRLLLKR